jgi:hypothetical protein
VPYELIYLRTLAFIVTIASIVQLTELIIEKTSPVLHQVLGIYLPLITTNCAVLGVPLLNIGMRHDMLESMVFGLGAAAGFTLALILFAGIRERLEGADVPVHFRGTAIAMITAGIMSLAFLGFAGLDSTSDHRLARHGAGRRAARGGARLRRGQVPRRGRSAGRENRWHPAPDPVRPVRLPGLSPLCPGHRQRRRRHQLLPAGR